MHDYLTKRGIREACEISIVMPFGVPVPPSPDSSKALLSAFDKRNIRFLAKRTVRAIDPSRKVAILDDESEMPFELFLGIPKHRVPEVVAKSALAVNGWIPVDPKNLKTQFPHVYAIGDVTSVGTPKAGTFAEGAAHTAAASIMAEVEGSEQASPYKGQGTCYVEFGNGLVGRVNVDFFSGPSPFGNFAEPSVVLAGEKEHFGESRKARWFGL
jgi:sulfide:quinone oxidoreductase